MSEVFRVALAQLNPTVGALNGNVDQIKKTVLSLKDREVDYIVFPELFLSGYPVQDLVSKKSFVQDCMGHLKELANWNDGYSTIGVGCPWMIDEKVYNCFFVLSKGEIQATIQKHHLPNTEVFDEIRQFTSGPISGPYRIGDVRVGTPICEDAWYEDVCETLEESGAEILIVPNGSPYERNKLDKRFNRMVARVIETGLPLVYINMVGGQDDQVFDGGSFTLNRGGRLASQLPLFDEMVEIVEFQKTHEGWEARTGELALNPDEDEQDYRAIVEGVRNYIQKSGFSKVVLGLSGGIDSALVATLAVDAIGAENTRCVMLPSPFTSSESNSDALELIGNLNCKIEEIQIEPIMGQVLNSLEPIFAGRPRDLTEENIQSRIRGLLLMALSNKFGEILLTTGNKSEVAVGYSTIYGDMAGGYNPIKDLYKTKVNKLCQWRNENYRNWMKGSVGKVIPPQIISKPPTAELRENQKDTDSLPPYEVLDQILEMLIDRDQSVSEVVSKGFDLELVRRVEQLIYRSEYKRFQSAPGVRLTGRALWLDRRYPIVNQWRDSTDQV
ncbi:MAG: NAD+ synthase [Paracoccaceae bacterium]|nr:NAD+ synthase [Paracoccaceae bacterium]MDE2760641.1 NAD+ synthase [Paracoccaceae bacterium]MDE2917298.1 NAD+ synthase [Paracoccaceae bacterium]